jgi:hypothetical protein
LGVPRLDRRRDPNEILREQLIAFDVAAFDQQDAVSHWLAG